MSTVRRAPKKTTATKSPAKKAAKKTAARKSSAKKSSPGTKRAALRYGYELPGKSLAAEPVFAIPSAAKRPPKPKS